MDEKNIKDKSKGKLDNLNNRDAAPDMEVLQYVILNRNTPRFNSRKFVLKSFHYLRQEGWLEMYLVEQIGFR